ncbi:MAG: hypothetical protein U5K69_12940 [Balneolaceae bacterium]|nr:hypothetical protein [Balneolaceae bacterium]
MFSVLLSLILQANDFSTSSQGREYAPPDGPLYYIVLVVSALIVIGVVYYTVKWFIWPGEQSEDHIKRKILEDESN